MNWTPVGAGSLLFGWNRLNLVFALSLMRRTLLAFASKTGSKDMRTKAARRGYVFAAASISRKHMRSVARGRIGSGDGLFRWRLLAYGSCSATVVAHGCPGALGSADIRDIPRRLLQAASRSRSGRWPRSDRAIAWVTHAHATGGGFPDAIAAGGTRASRMHDVRNGRLTSRPE
jgi:hypothetical protein